MHQTIKFIAIILSASLLSSCAYNTVDRSPKPDLNNCNLKPAIPYSRVDSVFTEHGCNGCHSGGQEPNFQDSTKIKEFFRSGPANRTKVLGTIKRSQGSKAMPPTGAYPAVPSSKIADIEIWICQGMK
jgi:hypothetical protein